MFTSFLKIMEKEFAVLIYGLLELELKAMHYCSVHG